MRVYDTHHATLSYLDLGKGYDTFAGAEKAHNNVTGEPALVNIEAVHEIQFCDTVEKLMTSLNISSSIAGSFDFLESLSGKVDYYHELAVTTHSLSVVVYAVHAQQMEFKDPLYTGDDPPTPETALAFYQRHGDAFISTLKFGGEYIATYVFYSQTIEEKNSLITSLNGKGIFDGGKVGANFSETMKETAESTIVRWKLREYIHGYDALPADIYEAAIYVRDHAAKVPEVLNFAVLGYEEAVGIDRAAIAGIITNRQIFNGQVGTAISVRAMRNALYTLKNQTTAMQTIVKAYNITVPEYDKFLRRCARIDADITVMEAYVTTLKVNPVMVVLAPARGKDGIESLAYGTPRSDAAELPISELISWGGHNYQPWTDVIWTDSLKLKRLYSLQFRGDAFQNPYLMQIMPERESIMARILFVTWYGGGNQAPAVGLAQELRQRGHEVTFAGYEVQRERFEALGIPFTVLARSSEAYRSHGGPFARIAVAADVLASADHLRDVPDIIARTQCDGLVVDCLQFGALAAAEDTGLPVAVLVHSAPGVMVPPGGRLEGRLLAPVNALRATAGKPPVTRLWEAWSSFPTLCATLAELDPQAAQMPSSFEYVGPIFERMPASGWRSPWPADDPRPLVLLSFSTHVAWDQTSRIQRTLAALADSHYRVLVTTGRADHSGLATPENVALVPYIPHAELMPQAAVCVTHAGHGTVTAALAAGVPLVCLPNPVADQPPLAAQVEALGAGRTLDGEACTAAEIATAMGHVFMEPSYAATARRLAKVIAGMPGATIAASRVAEVVGGTYLHD